MNENNSSSILRVLILDYIILYKRAFISNCQLPSNQFRLMDSFKLGAISLLVLTFSGIKTGKYNND